MRGGPFLLAFGGKADLLSVFFPCIIGNHNRLLADASMKIEIRQIQKKYGKKEVLKQASFAAESGMCVGILGSNGSGKSTLLAVLAGVQRPNGGEFLCDGVDLFRDRKRRAGLVGYVPQGTPLLEELTAWDNLRLWYDRETLKKELSQGALAILGIEEFIKVRVGKMSEGMKKRLSIGCAVARAPKILLLDEPSAALDLVCKERLAAYFRQYKAEGGILILATHDTQELDLCDQLYILKDGKLAPCEYDGNVSRLIGQF